MNPSRFNGNVIIGSWFGNLVDGFLSTKGYSIVSCQNISKNREEKANLLRFENTQLWFTIAIFTFLRKRISFLGEKSSYFCATMTPGVTGFVPCVPCAVHTNSPQHNSFDTSKETSHFVYKLDFYSFSLKLKKNKWSLFFVDEEYEKYYKIRAVVYITKKKMFIAFRNWRNGLGGMLIDWALSSHCPGMTCLLF